MQPADRNVALGEMIDDALKSSFDVVRPIATGIWRNLCFDAKFPRGKSAVDIAQLHRRIIARGSDDDGGAIDRNRHYWEIAVIGMLADEVDATRRTHREKFSVA